MYEMYSSHVPVRLGRLMVVAVILLAFTPSRVLGHGTVQRSFDSRLVTQQPIASEVTELLADDAPANRKFGQAIAVSHDTIIVGAPEDAAHGSRSGAAYVFVRNAGGADEWSQVKKLTASDAAADAHFGFAVAISGDTIVVGAFGDSSYRGAAYVFERNADGVDEWGQVRKLIPTGGAPRDYFGEFVDMSGDTIVVGAPMANSMDGAAYVFERNTGAPDAWGQVTELVPATPVSSGAQFGWSVAISGGTAVVGAHYDGPSRSGSAYVFERNEGSTDNWGEVRKITGEDTTENDDFGYAVDVAVDTLVVGARYHDDDATGSAYVFERNVGGGDNWGQVEKLTAMDGAAGDRFGTDVAIHGESILIGSPQVDQRGEQSGAAHLFSRNQGGQDNWGHVETLYGRTTEASDYFGKAVAISGHTVVVGAPQHAGGAAYVFGRRGVTWQEEQKRVGDDTVGGDLFGQDVAISGDTLVVGAPTEDRYGDNAGAAYVLARNEGGLNGWHQVKRLPIGSSAGDKLGSAVDISGDWAVVGAPGGDWATLCERNDNGADAWGIVRSVSGLSGTSFGQAVAISGDTLVVGAPEDDAQGHSRAGTASIYIRNRGGADKWGFLTKLDAGALAADNDRFGQAVPISGDTIVVGAYYADPDGNASAGAVYVFERNFGGADNWGMVGRLVGGDVDGGEWFGKSVAIDNDMIIVGAPLENLGGFGDGAVYVFERNWGGSADVWGQVEKLTALDADGGDYFGWTVDLSFDVAVVGAYLDDSAAIDAGAAYVFERNSGGADAWGQIERITADDAAAEDYSGMAVSISGGVIAVGAPFADEAGSGSGSAYVYRWQAAHVYLPLVVRSD